VASGSVGTQVTVIGQNFSGAAGRLQVFFGNMPSMSVTVVDDSHVLAVVPAGSGTVNVTVQSGVSDPNDPSNINSPIFGYGVSAVSAADRFSYTSPLIVTAANWTSAGLTLTLGSDGNLHIYITGTTSDAVAPSPPASVSNIEITAPSNTTANLTINSTAGDPIPAGGLTYSGAGGLIKTGSGKVTLSGANTYTGGTTVFAGTLLINAANALPDGGSLTIGAGGTFTFDPSSAGTSGNTSVTTAAPVIRNVTSSVPVLSAKTAADVVNPSIPGRHWQLPIVLPTALQPPQSVAAARLGTPTADVLAGLLVAKRLSTAVPMGEGRYVRDLAWLGQATNSSDNSDQDRKKDVAIMALEAAFVQYGP
jgi:autotransporter-associated beta strand protein